jgi:tRNA-uridine aminocarboxypropyltransferase
VTCLCRLLEGVPPVDNRTGIIILQHPRERLHPLGTAWLVQLGLRQVHLEVAYGDPPGSGVFHPLDLPAGTALLYPGDDVPLLKDLPAALRPAHMLLLDATWPNARKLYRDNSWLGGLPRVRLAPAQPGRYRIRDEPDDQSLATVEAVVQALQILEPETAGLDALLGAFEAMNDRQLELGRGLPGGPRRRLRKRIQRPIPAALLERPERVVVVYGESAPDGAGGRHLIHWTALHPTSGACFERLLRPGSQGPSPARQLRHMGLTLQELEGGVDREQLTRDWRGFLAQTGAEVLAAWNASSLELMPTQAPEGSGYLLKAAYCNVSGHRASGSLDEVVAREGLSGAPVPVRGRAALRLGQAVAMLAHLRAAGGE